jgi:hypothetical protein
MKKYLFMCAGALMLAAACTKEEGDLPSAAFIKVPATSLNAVPKEQSISVTVWRIANQNLSSPLTVSVTASWDGEAAVVGKIDASVDGTKVGAGATQTVSLTIPANETSSAEFTIKVKSTQTLRSSEEAKLKLVLANAAASQSGEGDVTITIKGSSPLASAPEYDVVYGRALTDTLWFGTNKDYYAAAPAATAYKVEVKRSPKLYDASAAFAEVSYAKIDGSGKVGIAIAQTDRSAWVADDTISIRLTLPDQGTGIDDTLVSTLVVKADKLANKATYDFTDRTSYFAVFAGEITAKTDAAKADAAKETAKTDLVFYLDTVAIRTDTTFVLKMVASDSCQIALVASTEAAYEANLRSNNGAENVSYGALANTIIVPADGSYIGINDYLYYAVKITFGAGIKPKTYYGYLRLRTIMPGIQGDPHKFERVEFTLNYGEARNYEKE